MTRQIAVRWSLLLFASLHVHAQSGVKPVIDAVNNTASGLAQVARGSLASIYGSNLASVTAQPGSLPLATELAGVRVTVAGIAAPLVYVSPGQLNIQIPFEVPLTPALEVVVIRDGIASAAVAVPRADYAVGFFQYARGNVFDPIIVHAATNLLVTPSSPAAAGEFLVAYATGFGKLTNAPATGAAAPRNPTAQSADPVTITLGNMSIQPLFVGLTPDLVGLIQINFQMPSNLFAPSCLPFSTTVAGSVSPQVNLYLAAGNCAAPAPPKKPVMVVGPTSLQFGSILSNATADRTFQIQNTGDAELTVIQMLVNGAGFSLNPPAPFNVPVGTSRTVAVRFAPTGAGTFPGSVIVTGNDLDNPNKTVTLTGAATTPPPAACAFTVSSPSATFTDLGGLRTLNILANRTDCQWNAVANASWISITSGNPGTGNGSITYTLARNFTADPRSGVIAIGGATHTVTQSGGPYSNVTVQIDSGRTREFGGFVDVPANAVLLNRLTPPRYPATLREVQIYFPKPPDGLIPGAPVKLWISTQPTPVSPLTTPVLKEVTVTRTGDYNVYTVDPVTINLGEFWIGFQTPSAFLGLPTDATVPPQGRSWIGTGNTFDPEIFRPVEERVEPPYGVFLIRANVAVPVAVPE